MGRLLKRDLGRTNHSWRQPKPMGFDGGGRVERHSTVAPKRLLREMHTHQVELEVQNEELRTTQIDLQRAHERSCALFHQAPVGYVVVDDSSKIRQANDAFARMIGQPAEALVGDYFVNWLAEPERAGFLTHHRALVDSASRPSMDATLVVSDGTRSPVRLDLGWLAPAAGDSAQLADEFLVAVVEESAARMAERPLTWREEQYRLLVDNSQDVLFTLEHDGVIQFASQSWKDWLGHEPHDVVGRNMSDFVHADDRLLWEAALSRAFETGERQIGLEYRMLHADGSTRWYLTHLAPARRSSPGWAAACVGNARDISERKRSEAENRRLQDQLHQASKMEAIGRLAGGVAHDFSNLLTSITCNVSMALMDLTPEHPLAAMLREVKQAADSAADLTRHLLAFSRKQVLEPKVVRLDSLVLQLQKMLSRLIGEDIALETRHTGELYSIKADPRQIEQILVNLIVNARDAMPGGGRILVETSNVELTDDQGREHADVGPGSYVVLQVTDTGQGMNEEVKRHLFEPFFTTKPRGRGTGFGLATIYGIVRQGGGAIEVDSVEGRGTVVRILWPRTHEPLDISSQEPGPTGLEQGTETILLVEDEALVRKLGTRILTRLGYKVLSAGNADEALAIVDSNATGIDLLFTDVIMPGMSGRDLAEQIRARNPSIRVLYTSGYTENVMLERGLVEHGVSYLSKPYRPQALARVVREALGQGAAMA